MGVGMPHGLRLQQFGDDVRAAFDGHIAYHVGSSLADKAGWRDVDVRLIVPDEWWAAMGLGDPENPHSNPKWRAITLAWSAYGLVLTGLPIDFQIQQRTHANAKYKGHRSALFQVRENFARVEPERLAPFVETMRTEVIPEIVERVRQRQEAAAATRDTIIGSTDESRADPARE